MFKKAPGHDIDAKEVFYMKKEYDVLIVGTGAAGLYAALNLPESVSILLISKRELSLSNSSLAQGGVAAVLDRINDDYELHISDTMTAGKNLNDRRAVEVLVKEGPSDVLRLSELGVDFDLDENGEMQKTLEAGHSRHRIVHHKDSTGKAITDALIEQVKKKANVDIYEQALLYKLEKTDGGFFGGILFQDGTDYYVAAISESGEMTDRCGGRAVSDWMAGSLAEDAVNEDGSRSYGTLPARSDFISQNVRPDSEYAEEGMRSAEEARSSDAKAVSGYEKSITREAGALNAAVQTAEAQLRTLQDSGASVEQLEKRRRTECLRNSRIFTTQQFPQEKSRLLQQKKSWTVWKRGEFPMKQVSTKTHRTTIRGSRKPLKAIRLPLPTCRMNVRTAITERLPQLEKRRQNRQRRDWNHSIPAVCRMMPRSIRRRRASICRSSPRLKAINPDTARARVRAAMNRQLRLRLPNPKMLIFRRPALLTMRLRPIWRTCWTGQLTPRMSTPRPEL